MKDNKSNVTSERIKELRLKNGYTIEKLAEMIGVSKSTISKWENGYVDNMRQDMIFELSKIFNVTPTYIMGYDIQIGEFEKSIISIQEQVTSLAKSYQKAIKDNENQKRIEHFISLYTQLGKDEQLLVDNMLEALSKKQ